MSDKDSCLNCKWFKQSSSDYCDYWDTEPRRLGFDSCSAHERKRKPVTTKAELLQKLNELYDIRVKFDGASIEITSCGEAKMNKVFVRYYTPEGKYIEEEVSVPGETSEKVGRKPLAVWIQEEIDDLIMDNPHPAKAFAKGQQFAYNRVLERLENENDPS